MRTFIALSALCATALAHMEMSQPFPFRSKFDPNGENIDYSMTNPLDASGSDFPCKGYHQDGTPATAEYNAGESYQLTIAGSATHNGGSCQISLSFDGGSSFQVIKSMMGGCPLTDSYDFTVPADTPSGDALLAWTWFNKTGNREMYMNCAPVKIGGGGSSAGAKAGPAMFVANVGNGCTVPEGTDAVFAEPGPDVVYGEGVDESSPVAPQC